MKRFPLFPLLLLLALLLGCDEVDSDERFSGPLTIEAKKNVLIEDFTGQRCTNCPNATDEIVSLQGSYGAERLIAVSIHGGSLSLQSTESSSAGLATEQGNEYHTHFGLESWPKGMVDRTGGLLDYEAWNAAAFSRFGIEPKVDLQATALDFDAQTRSLTLSVSVTASEEVSGNLQLWLTESQITAVQFLPTGGVDTEYVHNHVFRASINDPYGDPLALSSGESVQKSYSYSFERAYWQAENMALVAFFYNDDDGVMQVIETSLLP